MTGALLNDMGDWHRRLGVRHQNISVRDNEYSGSIIYVIYSANCSCIRFLIARFSFIIASAPSFAGRRRADE
jgi:hypothetical protein